MALSFIIIAIGVIFVLLVDLMTREEREEHSNYTRIDSVTLVDIHGNIIIIEENGKYTRFWKKNID